MPHKQTAVIKVVLLLCINYFSIVIIYLTLKWPKACHYGMTQRPIHKKFIITNVTSFCYPPKAASY